MAATNKRALISVSDKEGIVDFARSLTELGVEIVSTGGTHRQLEDSGVPVINISEVTGFPEILDGRVKTLHPNIHSGLLAVRSNEDHMQQLQEHNIAPIDFVIVNLYPFAQTIAKPDVSFDDAIENIDIGGPSMLRAAAKNHQDVTIVVDKADYATVIEEMKAKSEVSLATKQKLATKVFRHTAAYDSMIAEYLTEQMNETLPEKLTVTYEKMQDLRYGENPHQQAGFYQLPQKIDCTIATAKQLHGKELSYNNINDADAALAIIKEFEGAAVVAVKHSNPCGIGLGDSIQEAYMRAFEADPISIFGGIVALNRPVNLVTAERLSDIFLEIIIAPDYEQDALELLSKKKNIRLLKVGEIQAASKHWRYQTVAGGVLVQEQDVKQVQREDCQVVTDREPTEEEWAQLLFSWKAVKHVKSNAIVLARHHMTVGIGAGQMNRVGAARIAIEQAGDKSQGSVMASDAFFPMPDTVEIAAKAGVRAIIQPGGSIKDNESIAEANRHGMAMVVTGVRHFRH